MQLQTFAPRRLRARHVIAPFVIAAALVLAACGGSSSKATGTAVASSSTIQATTAPATAAAGMATAEATGQTTAGATAESTATTSATAESTATTTATAESTATTTATAESTATTATATEAASPLEKLTGAWKDLKSYKMTVKVYENGSDTASITGTVETVAPDKSHTVVSISGQEIETISIGDTTYIKIGGIWQKAPGSTPNQMPPVSGADILNELSTPEAAPTDVKKTGEETINGVKCDVYEIKTSDSGTSTFWIGQKDHLPYKITSQADTTRSEIIFSDFNANFDIKAPI